MDNALSIHSTITKGDEVYTIEELIGEGASCTVYRATGKNHKEHLLKEYNPKGIPLVRKGDGSISLEAADEQQKERFFQGKSRFREAARLQAEIRFSIPSLKNSTSNVQDEFEANNTCYIDMTVFHGDVYSRVQEDSLYNLFCRMKALASILQKYHNNGYLHLDIKPDNIFTLPDTCEMLMLFDFDSVVKKEDLKNAGSISYSQSWAAPEQLQLDYRLISEATDFFPIGEMIFCQLFSRHSTPSEHRSFSKYPFGENCRLLQNAPEEIRPLIEALLRRTLCSDVKKRYQTAQELIDALDELARKADVGKPYLVSSNPNPLPLFVGRNCELQTIADALRTSNMVFLHGIGGIGKSEIAREYAFRHHHKEYDVVLFGIYEQSLALMFANAGFVTNLPQMSGEKREEYGLRQLSKLRDLCSDRVLLMIDNMDVSTDPHLSEVAALPCKTIITSREDHWESGYAQIEVEPFADYTEILALFSKNYRFRIKSEDNDAVQKLIEYVDRHTMAIELLAKQMSASRLSPADMLSRLTEEGLKSVGKETIGSSKDRSPVRQNAYGHIKVLFNCAKLSQEQISILQCLSLVPLSGIEAEMFKDWCGLPDYEEIDKLELSGWIRQSTQGVDQIALHPLIAEIVQEQGNEGNQYFERFIKAADSSVKKCKTDFSVNSTSLLPLFSCIAGRLIKMSVNTVGAADYYIDCANLFSPYGYQKEIIRYYQAAREIYEHYNEKNSEKAIRVLLNFSARYAEQHMNTEAQIIARDALSRCEKYFNGSKLLIDAIDRYGNNALTARDFQTAKREFQREEELQKQLFPDDRPLQNRIKSRLASLSHFLCDFESALNSFQEIFRSLEDEGKNEENSKEICDTMINMASECKSLGNYKKAEDLLEKAIHGYKTIYGEKSIPYADALIRIGNHYQTIGKRGEAYTKFLEGYEKLVAILGPNDYRPYDALLQIAQYESSIGKHSSAMERLKSILAFRETHYGKVHMKTAEALYYMGSAQFDAGKLTAAESLYNEAYDIYQTTAGEEHYQTLRVLYYLGILHVKMGKLDDAEKELRDAKVSFEKQPHNEGNIEIITVDIYRSDLLNAQGRFAESLELLLDVLERAKTFHRNNGQIIIHTQTRIGRCYLEERDFSNSIKHLMEAVNTNKTIRDESDPSFGIIFGNLALAYSGLGDYENALRYAEKECGLISNSYGEQSTRYADALLRKGRVLRESGQNKEAVKEHQKAAAIIELGHRTKTLQYGLAMEQLGQDFLQVDPAKAKGSLSTAYELYRTLRGEDHHLTRKVKADLDALLEKKE